MDDDLLRSPLHERHVALGAKFAPFAGWTMPLEYAGVLAEHTAVRERVGVFDVSHLGTLAVAGPGALQALNSCLTNDLDKIGDGQAQYTLLCADDGGVIDDLIVYRVGSDEALLVPNAANNDTVAATLTGALPADVQVENVHADYAIIAVQGPRSDETLAAMGLPVGHDYMRFVSLDREGARLTVCRTGYTGERGYELIVANAQAPALWDELLAAGEPHGVRPCGLASRDTLRTEMGYALHGHEISPSISPVQARLGWAIGWNKPTFAGAEALRAEKASGPARVLRGLKAVGRGIPRPGMAVVDADGEPIGEVTSGTYSPTLKTGIALALLDPGVPEGAEVAVQVRTRQEPFVLTKPPFVTPGVRA